MFPEKLWLFDRVIVMSKDCGPLVIPFSKGYDSRLYRNHIQELGPFNRALWKDCDSSTMLQQYWRVATLRYFSAYLITLNVDFDPYQLQECHSGHVEFRPLSILSRNYVSHSDNKVPMAHLLNKSPVTLSSYKLMKQMTDRCRHSVLYSHNLYFNFHIKFKKIKKAKKYLKQENSKKKKRQKDHRNKFGWVIFGRMNIRIVF